MFYKITKRVMDVVLSSILLILFAPVALITAIAIKIDSEGPVFADIPERVGKNGRRFKMYKFRSMHAGSHNKLRTDPKMKNFYEEYKKSSYKLFADPRITRVGKFIRKHSIDEVPQFLNVLKGEMSIVGPRAYFPDELEEQTKKYKNAKGLVKEALSVKPGITGPWQVSGRSEVNFDKRIGIDATYARKKSVTDDLKVLLKTPWAMISGKGAV